MSSEQRSRGFCFTINNIQLPLCQQLQVVGQLPHFRYAIAQEEEAATGTHHYQGYVEFDRTVRWNALRASMPGAHIERRFGSRDQAREYCRKADTRVPGTEPQEVGRWILGPGARTDLEELADEVRAHRSMRQIAGNFPSQFIRYHRGISAMKSLFPEPNELPPVVYLLYGATGIGKTRFVYDLCNHEGGESHLFRKAPQGRWFDGYDGHSTLLLDDFAGNVSGLRLSELLQVLDRYPVLVEVKGGFRKLCVRRIFVTCNVHPVLWYKWKKCWEQYAALERRFHFVLTFVVSAGNSLATPKFLSMPEFFQSDYARTCSKRSDVVIASRSVFSTYPTTLF